MAEETTIPDAAREAVVELVRNARSYSGVHWDNSEVRQEVDDALATAAPYIARAARIDELELVIDKCDGVYDTHGALLHAELMRDLRRRIAELEAQR